MMSLKILGAVFLSIGFNAAVRFESDIGVKDVRNVQDEMRAKFAKEVEELKGEARISEKELAELSDQNFGSIADTMKQVDTRAKSMSEKEAWGLIDHRLTSDARALLKSHKDGFMQQGTESEEKEFAPTLGAGTPVEKAMRFLNAEYKEVYEKLDVELFNCGMYKVEKEGLVGDINKDIADLATTCGQYVAMIQESQMNIDEQNAILAELNEQLDAHLLSCAKQIAIIKAQIAIVEDDLKVVKTIIEAGEEACKGALLLQKGSTQEAVDRANFELKGCRTGENGKLEMVTESVMINRALAQLKTEKAKDTARRILWEVMELSADSTHELDDDDGVELPDGLEYSRESEDDDDDGKDEDIGGSTLVQVSSDAELTKDDIMLLDGDEDEPHAAEENAQQDKYTDEEETEKKAPKKKTAGLLSTLEEAGAQKRQVPNKSGGKVTKAATKPSAKAQKSMCPLGTKPNCAPLLEKLGQMQGEIKDALDKLMDHLAAVTLECNTIEANFRSDIANAEHLVSQFTAKMTQDTALLQNSMYEGVQKEAERHEVCSEMRIEYSKCYKTIKMLEEELCGIIIIRFATHQKMVPEIKEPDFQDCIVSGWTPGECSRTCMDEQGMGGIEIFTREVTIAPNKIGAACPPLTWERACGEVICPLHCKLDIWGPWGDCTKDCGGGSQARTRHVLQEPTPGGTPCESTQMSRQCNTHSCDVDCVLHDWTAWSPCSKSCLAFRRAQVGMQSRKRHIRVAIKGNGKCPAPTARQRYETQGCNNFICPNHLNCVAPQDMILTLDGSGSLWYRSWQTKEWDRNFRAVKTFAKNMVEHSMMDGWDAIDQDSAVDEADAKKGVRKPRHVRMGVALFATKTYEVVSLTGDKAKLLKGIDGMEWPKGGTNTHLAIKRAIEMMKFSRPNRIKTIVLVTDGRATDRRGTFTMARKARKAGMIIKVVPVGRKVKRWETCRIASPPCNQNVELARAWRVLKPQLNKFIAGTCPKISTPPTAAVTAKKSA